MEDKHEVIPSGDNENEHPIEIKDSDKYRKANPMKNTLYIGAIVMIILVVCLIYYYNVYKRGGGNLNRSGDLELTNKRRTQIQEDYDYDY